MADDFQDVLGRLAADFRPTGDEPPAIAAAITEVREALPLATTIGEAFAQVDKLTEAVRATYPKGHCKAGCSGCCDSQTAIFDVSPAEWAKISSHLEAWDPARLQAFKDRFKREHGTKIKAYKGLSFIRFFEPISERYFNKHPYRCPFLEGGRCSIYPARPLACRMYGYFAIRSRFYERPSIYGCELQTAYYETREQLALPSVNMVAAQARRLTRGQARILPIWIAERL